MKLAELYTELTVRGAEQFNGQVSRAKKLAIGADKAFSAMAKASAAIFAAGGAMAAFSIKAASDAEEIGSKFEAVFKEQSKAAQKFSETFSSSIGRSLTDTKAMMATFQDTFVPLGFARKEAMGLSETLTQLAVDMASFNNKTDIETMQALQSALVGNHETMRQYSVIITQTTLEQELLNMGIMDGIKTATEQEKVQARLNIIMKGTKDAQGDAARTAGSFANQMKKLHAQIQDAAVILGEMLMPVAKAAVGIFSELTKQAQNQTGAFASLKLIAQDTAAGWVVAFAHMEFAVQNWEIYLKKAVIRIKMSLIDAVSFVTKYGTVLGRAFGVATEGVNIGLQKELDTLNKHIDQSVEGRKRQLLTDIGVLDSGDIVNTEIRNNLAESEAKAKEAAKLIRNTMIDEMEGLYSEDLFSGMFDGIDEELSNTIDDMSTSLEDLAQIGSDAMNDIDAMASGDKQKQKLPTGAFVNFSQASKALQEKLGGKDPVLKEAKMQTKLQSDMVKEQRRTADAIENLSGSVVATA